MAPTLSKVALVNNADPKKHPRRGKLRWILMMFQGVGGVLGCLVGVFWEVGLVVFGLVFFFLVVFAGFF